MPRADLNGEPWVSRRHQFSACDRSGCLAIGLSGKPEVVKKSRTRRSAPVWRAEVADSTCLEVLKRGRQTACRPPISAQMPVIGDQFCGGESAMRRPGHARPSESTECRSGAAGKDAAVSPHPVEEPSKSAGEFVASSALPDGSPQGVSPPRTARVADRPRDRAAERSATSRLQPCTAGVLH
jgi:hypothetical protein